MAGDLASVEYFENKIVCRDGTQRLMGWHNAFWEDDDGRVVGTKTVKFATGIQVSCTNGHPHITVEGVSLMGVPLPSSLLGIISNSLLHSMLEHRVGLS